VAVLSMSKQEFSRLEVLLRVQSGRLRINDACVLIGLQRRQLFRLLRGLKQEGATGLVSKAPRQTQLRKASGAGRPAGDIAEFATNLSASLAERKIPWVFTPEP
jgi:hypothetical protein